MNIADLTQSYSGKTDEELLRLAEQREHLTVEAQSALISELSRRRIDAPPSEGTQPTLPVAPRAKSVVVADWPIKTGVFIEDVLRFYSRHRWAFVQLIFPAVMLSFIAITFTGNEARSAVAQRLNLKGVPFPAILLLTSLIRPSGWLISWMAFCCSFAIISSAVEQDHAGYGLSISESFGALGAQLGRFLRLSMLLLGMFFLLEMALLTPVSIWIIPFIERYTGGFGSFGLGVAGGIEFWFVAFVFARFALAVPALILDDLPLIDSLFYSYKLTRSRLPILAALVFKGVVGSYIAAMLPFWLARWIPASVTLPSWFDWALSGASIVCVSVVEPVMFIGFAMLYLRTTAPEHVEAKMVSA